MLVARTRHLAVRLASTAKAGPEAPVSRVRERSAGVLALIAMDHSYTSSPLLPVWKTTVHC